MRPLFWLCVAATEFELGCVYLGTAGLVLFLYYLFTEPIKS